VRIAALVPERASFFSSVLASFHFRGVDLCQGCAGMVYGAVRGAGPVEHPPQFGASDDTHFDSRRCASASGEVTGAAGIRDRARTSGARRFRGMMK
jgi:hypothetical protein